MSPLEKCSIEHTTLNSMSLGFDRFRLNKCNIFYWRDAGLLAVVAVEEIRGVPALEHCSGWPTAIFTGVLHRVMGHTKSGNDNVISRVWEEFEGIALLSLERGVG